MRQKDLRLVISEANKKRWALVPKEVRIAKASAMGKLGGPASWAKLTVEERRLKVSKMNDARASKRKGA